MAKYIVSCDLLPTGENYDQLLDELKILNAVRVTDTAWILNSTLSVEHVARRITPHIERVFVAELAGLASWVNPLAEAEKIRVTLR
jgi:hypothetical protein